jgi:uncharacterized protein
MVLGVLTLHIWIDESHSLKEKRHVIQSLLDRIRARWNVSAAQLDDHDLWNRSEIGVAVVSNDRTTAERVLNHIRDFVDADPRCDLGACSVEIF